MFASLILLFIVLGLTGIELEERIQAEEQFYKERDRLGKLAEEPVEGKSGGGGGGGGGAGDHSSSFLSVPRLRKKKKKNEQPPVESPGVSSSCTVM